MIVSLTNLKHTEFWMNKHNIMFKKLNLHIVAIGCCLFTLPASVTNKKMSI